MFDVVKKERRNPGFKLSTNLFNISISNISFSLSLFFPPSMMNKDGIIMPVTHKVTSHSSTCCHLKMRAGKNPMEEHLVCVTGKERKKKDELDMNTHFKVYIYKLLLLEKYLLMMTQWREMINKSVKKFEVHTFLEHPCFWVMSNDWAAQFERERKTDNLNAGWPSCVFNDERWHHFHGTCDVPVVYYSSTVSKNGILKANKDRFWFKDTKVWTDEHKGKGNFPEGINDRHNQ